MASLDHESGLYFGFVTQATPEWDDYCAEPKARVVKDPKEMAKRLADAKTAQEGAAAHNPVQGMLREAVVINASGAQLFHTAAAADDTKPAAVQLFQFLVTQVGFDAPPVGCRPFWFGFNIKPILRMAALETARFRVAFPAELGPHPWMWCDPPAKDPYHACLTTQAARTDIPLLKLFQFMGLDQHDVLAGAAGRAQAACNLTWAASLQPANDQLITP